MKWLLLDQGLLVRYYQISKIMGTVQSMILGEANKAKPAVVSPVAKEEPKPEVKLVVDSAPDDPGLDEYPSNRSDSGGGGATFHQTQVQQPPKQYNNMGDIADAYYRDKMPTEEELKKERKRENARSIISAIADGVSAVSNLYFTGKGAKNVEQTSMSEANTKRYQEILDRRRKTKEKWDDARLAAYDRDRGFNYQKGRDGENWKRSGEWHDEQVKADNTRYADNKERIARIDTENKTDRDRNYDLNKKGQEIQEKGQKDASALGWANHGLQKKAQEDSARIQEERIKAMGGRATRGKRIGFSDGSGNDVGIYENVWRGSMQQVFDTLSKDFRPNKISESMWNRRVTTMTSREKEDFVKQNWTKSPRASAIMKALSQIDPAGMGADIAEEDPYAKYTTGDDPYAKYAE